MRILRRDFALLAGSTLLVTAFPIPAFADPDDTTTPVDKGGGHKEVHTSGSKHHDSPAPDHMLHKWSFGFHSPAIAQNDWKYDFPEGGQASILIDKQGNWLFQGSFPASKLAYACRVTVGFGLKNSSLGSILAVTKTLTVTSAGASWSKQGNNVFIHDLWKDVVKGYDWKWSAHTRHEVPAEPPPQEPQSGQGGDSTFHDVADDIAKSMLGPIGFFL
jgi:hypothetical protein